MPGDQARQQAPLIGGRYRLRRELGRGGMGVVWLAEDQLAGRRVAVKELRPPPGLSDADRDIHARRALAEARSAAGINHPGAVTLFDVLPATAADDAIYLIMELIDGPTLAQLISQEGQLPDATVASIGLQLLDVLQAAHTMGIVHRDIKPGNIMIAAGNQVKLTDFGIAHTLGNPRITHGRVGTEAYMAPERFGSDPITPAADLWSLGATLYWATAGDGLFERDATEATIRAVLFDDIPVPACSPSLAQAISGMLRRDPAQRATIAQARALLQTATTTVSEAAPDTDLPTDAEPDTDLQTRTDADTKLRTRTDTDLRTPTAPATVFTNMPSRLVLALLRSGWVTAIFGGAVVAFVLGHGSFGRFGLAVAVYLVFALVGTVIVGSRFTRRRTLILDSYGLAVRIATPGKNQHTIAEARWDQVIRIGCLRRPVKPHLFLSAWISEGESKPGRMVGLCPVSPPHFPMDEIRAAILSYCPRVEIDVPQAEPHRELSPE